MSRSHCSHLLPQCCEYLVGAEFDTDGSLQYERPECLLRDGHLGPHLIRFSDGTYVEWKGDDEECADPDCSEFSYCSCYRYESVSEARAAERFKESDP